MVSPDSARCAENYKAMSEDLDRAKLRSDQQAKPVKSLQRHISERKPIQARRRSIFNTGE